MQLEQHSPQAEPLDNQATALRYLISMANRGTLRPEIAKGLTELAGVLEANRGTIDSVLNKSGQPAGSESNPAVGESVNKDAAELKDAEKDAFILNFGQRFMKKPTTYRRADGVNFSDVKKVLINRPGLMWSLAQMENAGGNPDIFAVDNDYYYFADCCLETPTVRRDKTYNEALQEARSYNIDLMSPEMYRIFVTSGNFDRHSYVWLDTPENDVKQNKGLVGDRYGATTHITQVDADRSRPGIGWRGMLKVPRKIVN